MAKKSIERRSRPLRLPELPETDFRVPGLTHPGNPEMTRLSFETRDDALRAFVHLQVRLTPGPH